MKVVIFILLFVWQIIQNLVAICMLPFMGKKKYLMSKRYSLCIFCEGLNRVGSVSLGSFVLLGTEMDTTIGHELGHVTYSHWLGPLYLFTIGICSGIWALIWNEGDYYDYWTERSANNASNLHSEKNTCGNLERYHLEWNEGYSLDDIK